MIKMKQIQKGDKCVYCGCNLLLALTIDHKIPTSRGGGDNEENLQVCCWMCNQIKGSLLHAEFKKYLGTLQTLKSLKKIHIVFPGNLEIKFKQNHYPAWEHNEDIRNGKKTNKP